MFFLLNGFLSAILKVGRHIEITRIELFSSANFDKASTSRDVAVPNCLAQIPGVRQKASVKLIVPLLTF